MIKQKRYQFIYKDLVLEKIVLKITIQIITDTELSQFTFKVWNKILM